VKIYKWTESEHHYIAVVRPDELFDLTTLETPGADLKEDRLRAVNVVSGEPEVYAFAKSKKWWPREWWVDFYRRAPERFAERDAEQLTQLARRVDVNEQLEVEDDE
jgi:hypothetical protein